MESTVTERCVPTLDSLLAKVYQYGGYDFRDYKPGTVMRRLQRRLHATGAATYREYMQFLDAHPEEYQKLADDLTIKVSGFFRSPHSFQQVARLVLPELLEYKTARGEQGLRFWSTACARGEEPYSLSILLNEFMGQRRRDFEVQVYATDISRRALDEAEAGVYLPKDVEGVSPVMLQEYFTAHGQGYQVRADIRQMVSFSHFDLTATTERPFMNLDGIFCCNVLIYFQKPLQERVLNKLYASLASPGYLVLGEVETPTSDLDDRLQCLDSKARIYKKVNN